MASSDPKIALGNLVRLLPLHLNELPAHQAFESPANDPALNRNNSPVERPNLISFIEEVLDQATMFVDDTLSATFKDGGLKSSPPSIAKVKLLSRSIESTNFQSVPWINSSIPRNWSTNGTKPAEHWFARRSLHASQSGDGTADLTEFDWGLRHDHSVHEQEYTPDVFDSYKVLDWDDQIKNAVAHGASIDNYKDLSMSSKCYQFIHSQPRLRVSLYFEA